MLYGGTFHNGLAVEEFLKPHPRARWHLVQHQGVQSPSVGVGIAFNPFRRRHSGTRGRKDEDKDEKEVTHEGSKILADKKGVYSISLAIQAQASASAKA